MFSHCKGQVQFLNKPDFFSHSFLTAYKLRLIFSTAKIVFTFKIYMFLIKKPLKHLSLLQYTLTVNFLEKGISLNIEKNISPVKGDVPTIS